MDLVGSLVDTKLKIIPSKKLINFLKTIPEENKVTINIAKLTKVKYCEILEDEVHEKNKFSIAMTDSDFDIMNKISSIVNKEDNVLLKDDKKVMNGDNRDENTTKNDKSTCNKVVDVTYLEILDIEWLYKYLQEERNKGKKEIPFLHELLEGSDIKLPENEIIKRNPDLEARCVKLRSQQEAREYRKMTKTVDNVRMRYPEDSISYQLKHLNRQLIAVGQFIISIFAGFLFGFRGVEWMVGNLDFGFRLLLGVMCALVIALAEIYFLAKKLNEEYSIPEPVQLGGPLKFADQMKLNTVNTKSNVTSKEHID